MKHAVPVLALFAFASPISAVQDGPEPAPIEVGVSVTSTYFFARNYSGVDQVLLFQSEGARAWRTLAAGCDMYWEYPAQMLTGIRFEVATWKEGTWARTGTIPLDQVASDGADALWVQGDSSKTTWKEIGETLLVEDTGESIFPAFLPSPTSYGRVEEEPLFTPLHVPEITPGDDPRGDLPPEIEPDPLPPV